MEQYKVGQNIYFKKDMTTGYIKSCLVKEEYLVKLEDNTEIIVAITAHMRSNSNSISY